jgi:hypothetical protein
MADASTPPSMTFCLAMFFWVAVGSAFARYYMPSSGVVIDGVFLVIVMIVMGVAFSSILGSRCNGNAPAGALGKAIIFPWVFMLGSVLAILRVFPGWKQPFANTFGYLFISNPFVDGKGKLVALMGKTPLAETIKLNPGLLMNEFNASHFDAQVKKLKEDHGVMDEAAVEAFRRVVQMKDVVAEFLWHLLAGSVALIASYNILMNQPCS